METIAFTPQIIPQLVKLINAHISLVPPFWQVNEAQTAEIIAATGHLWDNHYPENGAETYAGIFFGLQEQGRIVAAGQMGYPPHPAQGIRYGFIEWLFSLPGEDSDLDILLDNIVTTARQKDLKQLAISRCAFGVGWVGVSDAWPHLQAGLERVGFTPTRHWILLSRSSRDLVGLNASLDKPLRVMRQANEHAGEWDLRVYRGDQFVGECQAWQIPRYFSHGSDDATWITVEYIGIEQEFRRQGIGRGLLCEQLRWQQELGRQSVLLWTEVSNQAMRRLAGEVGFIEQGGVWEFEKDLA